MDWTGSWFQAHYAGQNMIAFTLDQISQYGTLMRGGSAGYT